VSAVFGVVALLAAVVAEGHDCGSSPRGVQFGTHLFDRLDLNADGRLTRTEAQLGHERLFDEMDVNGDGRLDDLEVGKGGSALRARRFEARFEELDHNKNGRIETDEMAMPYHRFTRLDRNGDAGLSREELGALLLRGRGKAVRRHRRLGMFAQADRDHDGLVTRLEASRDAQRRFVTRDRDGDGTVTRHEMLHPPPRQRRR
jgi:Ca2+-binding EF-hand superfamily protein